jgi:hypothetical protein
MAESRAFTLYLTTGSHVVSADVAKNVLDALNGGELLITIPVDSLIDDDCECELTVSTRHVVGLLTTTPRSESTPPVGNIVSRLRLATSN